MHRLVVIAWCWRTRRLAAAGIWFRECYEVIGQAVFRQHIEWIILDSSSSRRTGEEDLDYMEEGQEDYNLAWYGLQD